MRRLGVAVLGLFVVVSSLASIPATAAGVDIEIGEVKSVDPASRPFEVPPATEAPTDEQRMPVLDLADLEGIWPDEAVEVAPAPIDPETPEQALEGTKLVPSEGSGSVDVYGVGPDDSTHVAVIYPEDVNKLQADGEWRDIKVLLAKDADGWRWATPAGASALLPSDLSTETPVTFTVGDGELRLSPTGGAAPGKADETSVTYPNVFPQGADLRYTATLGGLVEHIVLPREPSTSTFSFDIATKGLTLAVNEHGGIDVVDATEAIVAVFPAAVAYDSSEEPLSATGSYTLTETGDGAWQLGVTIDPEFLKTATYPVEIDPTWDDASNRDGYTNQSSAGTSYESDQYLQVDSGKRSYLRFQTGAIDDFDLVVYDATMFLYPQGSGGVTGGIDAKRVSQSWPSAGTLKWNNQPSVGAIYDTVGSAGSDAWWDWNLDDLYQHYLDLGNQYTTHYDNEGVALTASNPKTFHAIDSTLGNSDPMLYVTYNNPPAAPTVDTPLNNYVSESESLTLKVDGGTLWPNDPDGDEVLVSFQISDNGTQWDGSNLVFQSPYDDAKSFTVPAGVLLDGQQYWWRAVSRDVCAPNTQGLCSLTDGAGTVRKPKASASKGFTVALKHFGVDDKWHMWSHDVGNNMNLQVNGSNGNLVLDVPLDGYATPIGDLGIGLTYNSQQGADYGMGPGWDLAIGPRGKHNSLPIELTKMDTGNDSDLKVRFKGGRTLYFPHQSGKRWGATSAMSGYITQAKNDRFTYFAADGGMYTFDSGALNGAPILKAKPAQSSAEAPDKEFTYTYDTSLQLTKVEDPLSRDIDIAWTTGGKVDTITSSGYGGQVFTFTYPGGKLGSIATSVDNPSDGVAARTETVDFAYGTSGASTGKLTRIRDAHQTANSGDGWQIAYITDSSPSATTRVAEITAPSTGNPTTAPSPWRFRYHGPYKGSTAAGVCITDPRGTDNACDDDSSPDPAYETQVEFSWSGYPLKVIGAKDPADGFRRVSTYVFDNHNNLLCERSPEANAIGESCTSATNGQGEYTDLDDSGLSTIYEYLNQAPYRLNWLKRPAPNSTGVPRLKESYEYDAGSTFDGAHVELYGNDDLEGLPDAERLWTNLDQDWDNSSPGGVTGGNDTWGARLSTLVDLSGLGTGKEYEFRVFSDDGVRLSVEGSTILDCFGDSNPNESVANCGEGDVSKVVWGSDANLEIEYSDIANDAALTVKWDQGNGSWQVIPGTRLRPQLGLVTKKTYSRVNNSGTFDLWQERWTYPTADLKFRRLHDAHIREDVDASPSYKTAYTYDSTYGRIETETKASGTAPAQTTTFDWLDGAAPSGWVVSGQKVSCLETVTDDNNDTIEHQCNLAGDTVKTIQALDAVSGTQQTTSQTRTSVFEFDSLGRLTKTEQVETGQRSITIYDRAGRVAENRTLIAGTNEAVTSYAYDHAGHLMTETLPDPDGGGSATSPVISHQWNWVDLETKKIDARGEHWSTDYDHENRVVARTSPLGAVTETTYRLGTSINEVVVDAPSDASITTDYDVLGRKTAEKLESLTATTFAYDVQGNLISTIDPAGVRTDHTYSALSELTETTEFAQSIGPATTTNTYDNAGRLSQVNGPLTADDDRITYGYDSLWRMNSVTYEDVTLPGSTTKASLAIVHNDAGEQLKVSQPLTTTTTMVRDWTYDEAGRQITYTDAAGTTTTTYNKAGWVTQVADPRPETVHVGYDDLGRRVCRFTAACTGTTAGAETWTYDPAGNMTQAVNPTATFNMTYDDDGRLELVKRGTTTETSYVYTPTTGQLTSVADAAGTTAFTYNAAGQIATVDDPFATAVTTYGYSTTSGKLLTRQDAQADMTWTRAYETATGRLDTQTIQKTSNSSTLASFDLAYDPAGNVTQKASTVFANPSNTTWSYDYDGASRMIQAVGENATGAATTWDYTYDGGGNRTRAKTTTGSVVADMSTTYNTQGLPTTASDAVTGETVDYTHDAIGNLTLTNSSIGTNDWAQTWDVYGRMTCARQAITCDAGGSQILFTHDALDRARTRVQSGTTTTYTYRGISEQLVQTVGATTTSFASTASGHPMAQKVGTADPSYHLLDSHSDVVGLVSPASANEGTTAYDAYGGVLGVTGTQGLLGYQGDIMDPTTKQVDMGTRWYAPGHGRFTSRDVLFGEVASPMSLNQFAYGAMNPVTMWDPTGMMPHCAYECTAEQQQNLVRDWSQTYGAAVQAGTAGSTYSPSPPPPDPAPAFTYSREGGDFAVRDVCARRCGDGSQDSSPPEGSPGSAEDAWKVDAGSIPPGLDPSMGAFRDGCLSLPPGGLRLGCLAAYQVLAAVGLLADPAISLLSRPTEPRVSHSSGSALPNALNLDSAVPPVTGDICWYGPPVNANALC